MLAGKSVDLKVAVVNGSGAHFVDSDPIVMTTDHIREVVARVPHVIVVHLEAINHCYDSRALVLAAVPEAVVPENGETISLPSSGRDARRQRANC